MDNQNISKNEFIDFKPILRIGLKYWYIFVISIILCISCGFVLYKLTKPTFQVLANIMVKEDEASGMSGIQAAMMKNIPFGGLLGGSTSVNDELQLIGSYSTFRQTVKDLNLNEIYILKHFPINKLYYHNSPVKLTPTKDIADTLQAILNFDIEINKSGAGKIKAYTGSFLKKKRGEITFEKLPANLHTDYGDFAVTYTPFYVAGKNYDIKVKFSSYGRIAEELQKEVEIDLVTKKANMINLSLVDKDIIRGKDILNTIIQTYNNIGIEQRREQATHTITFLDGRLNVISEELTDIEKEIETYKKKNDLTDIEAEVKAIFANSGEFKKQQIEAETQYTIIDWVEKFMLDPENKYALIPLNIGLSDRNVLEGLQNYNDALLERMKLLKNTHESNPTIEIINEQINAMHDNMLTTIRSLKNGFSFMRKDLKVQEDYYTSRLKGAPTQEREFISIKRQQLLKQELYMFLLQKKEENNLTISMTTPKSQIIDPAYSLYEPLSPRMSYILMVSLVFAMLLGGCYISLKEYIVHKI